MSDKQAVQATTRRCWRSRFQSWGMIRTSIPTRQHAGRHGAACFRAPRRFWPLADQLLFNRQRAKGMTEHAKNEPTIPEAVRKRPCDCTAQWAMTRCHHTSCRLRRGEIVEDKPDAK